MPGPLLTVFDSDDLAFLDEQRVARLGTIDANGLPHLVPVCFCRIGQQLYTPIDAKPKSGDPLDLKRLRNLRERPTATLLVDRYLEDWQALRWLLVRAEATILDSGSERSTALDMLEERYPQYAAMGLARLGLPVIALEPKAASRWRADRATGRPT